VPFEPRRHDTFGGLVPSAATAAGGDTTLAALAVEHHADGAALPLLVLSDAPGPLAWEPSEGLRATDDAGGEYVARALSL
jgi:hypothetical protein